MSYCTGYDYCNGYPYGWQNRSIHGEMDPDSVLDWRFEWMLGGDTIINSDFTVTGASEDQSSFSGNATTVVISGGTKGQIVTLHNRITTLQGRRLDATRRIKIREL